MRVYDEMYEKTLEVGREEDGSFLLVENHSTELETPESRCKDSKPTSGVKRLEIIIPIGGN